MLINKRDKIAGQPILKVRKLLRKVKGTTWDDSSIINIISRTLEVNEDTATNILAKLEDEYLEKQLIMKEMLWVTTLKGNRLSLASAANPILRSTAERKVKNILRRVEKVNNDDYYLYKVKKVVLFGSYLSNKDKLGDVNIAIELKAKEKKPDKHLELMQERANKAIEKGRKFNNFVEKLYWGETEVKKFLKNRSRSISLHRIDDPILEQVKYKVIYENNNV